MADRDERYYRACLEHYSISRRGLLRGLFSGASKAAKLQQQALNVRIAPRPPGSVEEDIFLVLCQSCSACVDACQQQVIEMNEGYPQLNLDFNHCSHCGGCANVCPSGAIVSISSLSQMRSENIDLHLQQARADIGLRPIFSKSCNHRFSGSCNSCAKACPEGAIHLISHQLPSVNDAACVGCGQCRSACFIGAIQLIFKVAL